MPERHTPMKQLHRAHALAGHIELVRARSLRDADRRKLAIGHYFDPLAATCLGDLIYRTMTGKEP